MRHQFWTYIIVVSFISYIFKVEAFSGNWAVRELQQQMADQQDSQSSDLSPKLVSFHILLYLSPKQNISE